MIDFIFTCFLYYPKPVETDIQGFTIISEGVTMSVGEYRGEFYTLDHNYNFMPIVLTTKEYGDLPVCKVKGSK